LDPHILPKYCYAIRGLISILPRVHKTLKASKAKKTSNMTICVRSADKTATATSSVHHRAQDKLQLQPQLFNCSECNTSRFTWTKEPILLLGSPDRALESARRNITQKDKNTDYKFLAPDVHSEFKYRTLQLAKIPS
jgi:hypothetical protein